MGSIDTPTITENGSTQSHAAVEPVGDDQKPMTSSNEAPAPEAMKKRRSSILPLEMGTRVMYRWRDDKYHPVKVIEHRKMHFYEPNDYEYYVHYTEYFAHGFSSYKLNNDPHQKRKIDETHVEVGHEELDAASLREHEKFSKVKNISTIELGRYEIETWYFSPFPPEYNDSLKLYFCEFYLNFMKHKEQLQRNMVSFSSM
ncbi:putative MYST-like histone acetyltransferase 1 [Hibiscus syriacus]|uniref:Histone acetyltransferase n=1 Tax=Hibiscus syriacus TaxID=106335 RepID=A0A6A2X2T6_HIBSY|nr:putative MYST-like histone acetyltransferase 1 [Hibiscus syriacus]